MAALLWVGTEAPFPCTSVGRRHTQLDGWLRDGEVPWSVRLAALLLWAVGDGGGGCAAGDGGESDRHTTLFLSAAIYVVTFHPDFSPGAVPGCRVVSPHGQPGCCPHPGGAPFRCRKADLH